MAGWRGRGGEEERGEREREKLGGRANPKTLKNRKGFGEGVRAARQVAVFIFFA